MTPDRLDEWRALRAEQGELRARLERLEERLARFEVGETVAVAPVAPPPEVVVQPPPLPVKVAPAPAPVLAPERESVEIRIGTNWLVRVGVVLLLTSLAFLGDYLYRHVVPFLGPASKIGLLYMGAGALTGIGAWLERSRMATETPKLRNYARVVFAGGLAAVYYVTYAAHYYPNLRVIGSPLVAGTMLIGWSAFMVWLADRRGSETLATLAILLAFYASAVNEVDGFTIISNVPLAVGAVWLMRRHLWKIFPYASLLATYGSYACWRSISPYAIAPYHPRGGFWMDVAFLTLYWVLFTWAVFTTSERALPAARRSGFASLNNGAFFLGVTQLVMQDFPGSFWKWALGFGVTLIGLAEAGRRLPRQRLDRATEDAYLLGGVLLVTVGFVAYFSGWQLALMLAVQSTVLLAAAGRRENAALLVASVGTAALAFVVALNEPGGLDGEGDFRLVGPAIAAIMAINSWFCARSAVGNAGKAGGAYEFFALGLWLAWGMRHFPYEARFSLFALSGAAVFALGVETRRRRLTLWSYVLTCAGMAVFWLDYGPAEHRHWLQLPGIACLVAQQQFGRRRWPEATVSPAAQGAVITAAVLTAWVTWSAAVAYWLQGGGFTLAVSWSIYAAVVFAAGLVLRERVYRWLGLLVLVGTLAHVILLDIWQLDSLERFFSLLCLGIVLLAVGFFYTRFQSRMREFF